MTLYETVVHVLLIHVAMGTRSKPWSTLLFSPNEASGIVWGNQIAPRHMIVKLRHTIIRTDLYVIKF